MRKIIASTGIMLVSCTSPYPASVPDIPTTKSVSENILNNTPEYLRGIETPSTPGGSDTPPSPGTPEGSGTTIKQPTPPVGKIDRYTLLTYEVRAYDELIRDKIQKLTYQKYAASEIGLLGTITSVIAAASGAITTAIYSGGVGIGGGMVEGRYNYDSQVLNYRLARYKLNCIYRAMTVMPASERELINSDTDDKGVIVKAIEPFIRNVIYDIKFELESQQYSVSLVTPDIGQLTKLLKSYEVQDKKGDQGGHALALYSPESKLELLTIAEKIRAQVGICKIAPTNNSINISAD